MYKYKLVNAVRVSKYPQRESKTQTLLFFERWFCLCRWRTVILGARFSGVGIHKVLYRSGPYL